jgi:dTDP-4-amino-4,6-dideoxygalactose transaminase
MNDKMNDLEASLVLTQLKRLPELIAAREAIARRYIKMLSSSPSLGCLYRLPTDSKERVWYRFVVEMLTKSAETVVNKLERLGICAAIPVNDWRAEGSPPSPVADRAYRSLVSLPLYPTLTASEQDRVVEAFLKVSEDSAHV